MNRKVIIIPMMCLGFMTACGSNNGTKTVAIVESTSEIPDYTSDKEALETVKSSIDVIRSSDYYQELNGDDRIRAVQDELDYYAEIGFVQKDTIYYDEYSQTFTFAMKDGLTGAMPVSNISKSEQEIIGDSADNATSSNSEVLSSSSSSKEAEVQGTSSEQQTTNNETE